MHKSDELRLLSSSLIGKLSSRFVLRSSTVDRTPGLHVRAPDRKVAIYA